MYTYMYIYIHMYIYIYRLCEFAKLVDIQLWMDI